MRTEVKLNDVYYKLVNPPTQTLANQMASKVGQGASKYGDLTTWSAWIQDNWRDGVGKLNPVESSGFLYGEVETRVPHQIILPQRWEQIDTAKTSESPRRYLPTANISRLSVGESTLTREKLGVTFTTPSSFVGLNPAVGFTMYIEGITHSADIRMEIWSDTAGSPNALVSTLSADVHFPQPPGGYWFTGYGSTLLSSLSTSTAYWLVVYPTSADDVIVVHTSIQGTEPVTKALDGGVWSAITGGAIYTSTLASMYNGTDNYGNGFFRFNDNLYLFATGNGLWKYDTSDQEWDAVGTITDHVTTTGAVAFDTTVYFGNGGNTTTDYTTMNTSEAFTSTGLNGKIFAKARGRLWRAYQNFVEYSDDGAVWEPTNSYGDPIYVSDSSEPITGMAAMGDGMYVSTTAGLIHIPPGDLPIPIMPWGSTNANNGAAMLNFEGALYIVVNGRVVRVTEDGTQQDVWMTREDDLLSGKIGRVWKLARMNNWLLALVGDDGSDTYSPTVWAYQDNTWHFLSALPGPIGLQDSINSNQVASYWDIYFDRPTGYVWVVTPSFVTYRIRIQDYTLNPFNDPNSSYMYSGWIEWDWFDSPIREAQKDYDGVSVITENATTSRDVTIYWKDDDSTDWELLGTVDDATDSARWDVVIPPATSTRPNTKRFKLGLLLRTNDCSLTPRARAFRVKYHLMVSDWFRWQLVVDVSGRSGAFQMTADGTRNTLTGAQIKDNLDALAKQVPPFVYQDADGSLYEVKVIDANFTYTKWVYNESTSDAFWEGRYNLTIEQVTQGEYTP